MKNWTFDVPTEPGLYWFTGWLSEFCARHFPQEVSLVTVERGGNNRLRFHANGESVYPKDGLYGMWCEAVFPEPPMLNVDDAKKELLGEQRVDRN